jgi:hypothetical protein
MAVVNRTFDASEQKRPLSFSYAAVATGLTLQSVLVPYASTLNAVRVAAVGISGTPTLDMRVWRFIVGTGVTTIAGGATTLTMQAVGTSGVQAMVLAASGSTLLNLQAGDVITMTSGGANSAVAQLSGAVVIQALQDIRTTFGV